MQATSPFSASVRLILLLPPRLLLPADAVLADKAFALSEDYFTGQEKHFIRRGKDPKKDLDQFPGKLLYDGLSKLVTESIVNVHVRSLYETSLPQADEADRIMVMGSCTSFVDQNPTSALYMYLPREQAEQFLNKLTELVKTGLLAEVYISSCDVVPNFNQPPASPLNGYRDFMGIKAAHTRYANDGLGQRARCTVVEFGWDRSHAELPDYVRGNWQVNDAGGRIAGTRLVDGGSEERHRQHGRQTLGVLLSSKSGIVPRMLLNRLVNVQATPVGDTSAPFHPEAALLKAITYSKAGDILLIEQTQCNWLPVESQAAFQPLLRLASHCRELTVIQPAGNTGNLNLDGAAWLTRDRGSVLVGAAVRKPKQHDFENAWNYSLARIAANQFCFGPTPIPSIVLDNESTTSVNESLYGQTSAASAVIAGVACQIQSVYKSKTNNRHLKPKQMRALLCDPKMGEPVSVGASGTASGTMPGVTKILDKLESEGWPSE